MNISYYIIPLLYGIGVIFNNYYIIYFAHMMLPILLVRVAFIKTGRNYLDVRVIAITFFAAYISLPALFALIFGATELMQRFPDNTYSINIDNLNDSFIFHAIFIFLLYIFAFWNGDRGKGKLDNNKEFVETNHIGIGVVNILYVIIISIVMILMDVRSILNMEYVDYHKFSIGRGHYLFIFNTLPLMFGYNMYYNKDSKKSLWLLLIVAIAIFITFITGKRSYLFPVIICMLLTLLSREKITVTKVIIILSVLYIGMQVFALMRFYKSEESFAVQIEKGWMFFKEHPEMLISDEFSSAVINTSGIIHLIRTDQWEHTYGKSIAQIIPLMIPRVISGEREISIAQKFAKRASFERFRAGGGFGFSVVGDSYINLGIFGIIIVAVFFGNILSLVARTNSATMKVLIVGAMPAIIFFTRSSIVSTIKSVFLYSIVPMIVITVVNSVFMYKKTDKVNA